MVLDLQLGRVVARDEGEVEVVLVLPLEPFEGKLLFCQNSFGKHSFLANHFELIR